MKFKYCLFLILCMCIQFKTNAQRLKTIEFNKTYTDIKFGSDSTLIYELSLKKNGLYKFSVMQEGIDVVISLKDKSGKKIKEMDSPNGSNGLEVFELSISNTANYLFEIKKFEGQKIKEESKISFKIKEYTKSEIARIEKIKKELEPENKKDVQTIDIDHFWEAYDKLATGKTHKDSVEIIQTVYLDRATNGLKDFIKVRNFTAEKFVRALAQYPKFYKTIRPNTYAVKQAAPLIEENYKKFRALYPNYKASKVCFAIGFVNTGGTVSNEYVLIGTEISTSTKDVDLSEFVGSALYPTLSGSDDIVQKLKDIVAHESVHTQQPYGFSKDAIQCDLLYDILNEGIADFIGEKISGSQINKSNLEYGLAHEEALWKEMKAQLCTDDRSKWLYNYGESKDRPADLGYFVGYRIAQAYYEKSADKKQAIVDLIEMNDPIKILQLSGYDRKFTN